MLRRSGITPDLIEQACIVFFRKPALDFSRKLRSNLDRDPEYLRSHESEVFPQLEHFLSEAGVWLDGGDHGEQMRTVAREVVVRLRSIEKGEAPE